MRARRDPLRRFRAGGAGCGTKHSTETLRGLCQNPPKSRENPPKSRKSAKIAKIRQRRSAAQGRAWEGKLDDARVPPTTAYLVMVSERGDASGRWLLGKPWGGACWAAAANAHTSPTTSPRVRVDMTLPFTLTSMVPLRTSSTRPELLPLDITTVPRENDRILTCWNAQSLSRPLRHPNTAESLAISATPFATSLCNHAPCPGVGCWVSGRLGSEERAHTQS